ncbi:hypothetical protein L3Q82_022928 [Scortum barcoo]|uniref:Uncharacterized protein n=1 Tax=Scortum barcoo TaxID=214431 RepID=A0ACB8WX61_9TELE|nr:hypothetical protein L3Q82_022928 [Scortum barcoo]
MDSQDTLQLLQVHHREDPDWLHHRLVLQLHRPQPCKALQRVVKAAQHIHQDGAAIHGRTSTPSGVGGRPPKSSKTPITQPQTFLSAAIWPTVPAAFEPEPPGSGKLHPAGLS